MKRMAFLLLPFLLLTACGKEKESQILPPEPEEIQDYVLYYYNIPRQERETPSGEPAREENLLYRKETIVPGQKLIAPADPTRDNYEFVGWWKEEKCLNEWNFDVDVAMGTTLLYAKWTTSVDHDDYIEPEYVPPEETIITDADFRLDGVFTMPIDNSRVGLTTGSIARLAAHADDVTFALNYARRADVTITEATYDADNKNIHIAVSSGTELNIGVDDITESLKLTGQWADSFEKKAENYAKNGANYEDYHIMLAGSSSMENWSTSAEDMAPIVTYNHGIGGTTAEQWTTSLNQRLVYPYNPKAVTYYVGVNNIINDGQDGRGTAQKVLALFEETHSHLPHAHIFYVLINRLPSYLDRQAEFDIVNKAAIDYANEHDFLTCIDAGVGLLKENGNPSWAYFLTDGLHMSKYGYTIWGKVVRQSIIDWLG